MSEDKPTVLIIDDEALVLRASARVLKRQGYEVLTADGGQIGLEVASTHQPHVALVDLQMPGMHGTEVVARMREVSPYTECVVVTGHGTVNDAEKVLKLGASDYFEKPISDWARFHQVIRQAIRIRGLKRENAVLRTDGFDNLIGNSPPMRKLKETIRNFAPHDVPMLITGESGTGKERVARAIHDASGVADGPFVAVNCGAIPDNLVESQLFGAVRGAFTGANRETTGFFGAAAGGTLFLDEIGELPLSSQPKLLRVLQEREFTQIGGTRPRRMTARILAATHQDLPKRIRDGEFREDLYHRLRVLYVDVPPLRERRDDIPHLTYFFVQKLAAKLNKKVVGIDDDVRMALTNAPWQNNVRDLENTLYRAMILCDSDRLQLKHFNGLEESPAGPSPTSTGPEEAATPDWFAAAMDMDWAGAKAEVELQFGRAYCIARLKQTGWNITRAAEMSGMQRPNFKRLVKRLNIEKPDDIKS